MIECIKFKEYKNGCLLGFADFRIQKWGAVIHGCSVYEKNGQRWVNFPSKEYMNENNEKKFAPFFRFDEDKIFKAFSAGLKEAFDRYLAENVPSSLNEISDFSSNEGVPF